MACQLTKVNRMFMSGQGAWTGARQTTPLATRQGFRLRLGQFASPDYALTNLFKKLFEMHFSER